MGHNYIDYEGDYEQFRDFDIWTLRHFFIEEARAVQALEPSHDTAQLCEFFEKWEWIGPGVFIGTDFSKYVLNSRPRWEIVLQLLKRTGDRISGFGEFVPLDYLVAHINTVMDYATRPQPTRSYLDCIGRICKLLSKHEPRAA